MSENNARLFIKVQPNAGRNELVALRDGVWKIKIAAQPEKGKANKELIDFLSDILGVRKDNIAILKGETSHNKLLSIEGLSPTQTTALLLAVYKKQI